MWSRKQNKNKKFYLLWPNKRDSSHSTLPLFSLARPTFLPTFFSPLSYHTSYLLQWWNQIVTTSPITSWQIDGETMETVTDFIFLGSKITEYGDCSYEIKKCLLLGRKAMTNLDRVLKSRDITLPTKVRLVKAMAFPVVMYRCESWTIKKAECQRTDAFKLWLEKTLENPLDSKEIKPVSPKGSQPWILAGKTDAEAEAPMLWPPDAKNWLIGKGPDAGKEWRQQEKGTTEDEMVGWHHRLDGHEFKQAPGDGDGQGSLACCSPWGCKELGTTERLNNHELLSNHLSSSIKTSTYFCISVHKNYSSLSVYPVSLSLSLTIVILDHPIL